MPNFPRAVEGSIGGLTSNKNPIICGGFNKNIYLSDCSTYEDGVWNKSMSMTTSRVYAAASQSPYPNRQQSLFVSGGYNNQDSDLNTTEVLSDQGWQELPFPLPVRSYYHCMVLFNSTTVLLIGGRQNGEPDSPNSFFFNTENEIWVEGPKLLSGRQIHSCGKLLKDNASSQFSVIVVGGRAKASVEILDVGATEWRNGPNLPFAIYEASMVEDTFGGILLIGGNNGTYLDTIFQLPRADSEWILMPQKLKVARSHATAFLVPGEITNCN